MVSHTMPEYHNTEIEGVGFSLVQLLMGCRLKSKLLTSTTLLTPEGKAQVHDNLKCRQVKKQSYYARQTTDSCQICKQEKRSEYREETHGSCGCEQTSAANIIHILHNRRESLQEELPPVDSSFCCAIY